MNVKTIKRVVAGVGAVSLLAFMLHGCGGKPHEPLMQGYMGKTDPRDDVTDILVFDKFDPSHAIYGIESRQMNVYSYVPIEYSSHRVKVFLKSKKTLVLDISEDGYTLTCSSCVKEISQTFHVVTQYGATLSPDVVDSVFKREQAMSD